MQSRRGWEQIEDDRLKKIIKKYGTKNWSLISQKLTVNTIYERTGKQCRQRWYNHLNPQINKKQWSKKQDQILFQAHRQHGSKWKQISKLFPGRTDNSIKNHFYSTVRRCLRQIGKLQGQNQPKITMKSIKPFVLSKIVQNTKLTQLIVQIGQRKYKKTKETESLEMNINTFNHIILELERINTEYEDKIASSIQSQKQLQDNSDNKVIQKPQEQNIVNEDKLQNQRSLNMNPSVQSLKILFSQENHHDSSDRYFAMQTEQLRDKNQYGLHRLIHMGQISLNLQLKQKHPTAQKSQNENKQWQDQLWVEQQSGNFFGSPLHEKDHLPDLRLLAKISRNSQSPGYSLSQERMPIIVTKNFKLKEEQLKLQFNPHDFFPKEDENQ